MIQGTEKGKSGGNAAGWLDVANAKLTQIYDEKRKNLDNLEKETKHLFAQCVKYGQRGTAARPANESEIIDNFDLELFE